MTGRGRAVAHGVALLAVLGTGRARAQALDAAEPPPSRVYVTLGVGGMVGLGLTIDGQPASEPIGDKSVVIAFAIGLERRVTRRLSLGVEGRGGSWNTLWAENAGYGQQTNNDRFRLDADAVLKLRAPELLRIGSMAAPYLTAAGGPTWPRPPHRQTRAVTEDWSPRQGWNAGVDVGVERWFDTARYGRPGLAVSVGYVQYWMTLDGTFTPVAGAGPAVSQRFRYVTHEVLAKLTVFAGF